MPGDGGQSIQNSLKLLFNGSHKTLTCSFNARMSTIKTDMADLQYRSQSWAFIRPSLLTWSLRPNRFPLDSCPLPCKVDSIDETDSVDFVADLMKACLI